MTFNLDYYMGPDFGGSKLLQNVGNCLQINAVHRHEDLNLH